MCHAAIQVLFWPVLECGADACLTQDDADSQEPFEMTLFSSCVFGCLLQAQRKAVK